MAWNVLGAVEKAGVPHASQGPLKILGDEGLLFSELSEPHLAIGVGAAPSKAATGLHVRRAIYERIAAGARDRLISVIDPYALIRGDVDVGHAVQILAGAIIQTGTRIGDNVVANSGCRIDHDCIIGNHAFIGPGAVLCGEVTIGAGSFIGANATVLPGISIGENVVVAAGSTVIRDTPADCHHPRSNRPD
jgi:UDP-perosamine 4-acetyltransferase